MDQMNCRIADFLMAIRYSFTHFGVSRDENPSLTSASRRLSLSLVKCSFSRITSIVVGCQPRKTIIHVERLPTILALTTARHLGGYTVEAIRIALGPSFASGSLCSGSALGRIPSSPSRGSLMKTYLISPSICQPPGCKRLFLVSSYEQTSICMLVKPSYMY